LQGPTSKQGITPGLYMYLVFLRRTFVL